jgi:hypothetical protein
MILHRLKTRQLTLGDSSVEGRNHNPLLARTHSSHHCLIPACSASVPSRDTNPDQGILPAGSASCGRGTSMSQPHTVSRSWLVAIALNFSVRLSFPGHVLLKSHHPFSLIDRHTPIANVPCQIDSNMRFSFFGLTLLGSQLGTAGNQIFLSRFPVFSVPQFQMVQNTDHGNLG